MKLKDIVHFSNLDDLYLIPSAVEISIPPINPPIWAYILTSVSKKPNNKLTIIQ